MTAIPEQSTMRPTAYRTHDVPVAGGRLRVGVWEPRTADIDTPSIVAIHGITGSHRAWLPMAACLPALRTVAPDLRGRGRSNELSGPYGMTAHAEDLLAVLDHLGLGNVVLVGHSMGAFVALVLAHRAPERVRGIILVDGGLPPPRPSGASSEAMMKAVLGPAAERLAATFPDRASYRAFWRRHPAFAHSWSDHVVDYVDYDLSGTEPELHPSANYAAVVEDFAELHGGQSISAAVEGMQHPTTILWAPRGLMNKPPGLYLPQELVLWTRRLPQLSVRAVADVNHYTIVMGERGAGAIAAVVNHLCRASRTGSSSTH